MKEGRVMTAYYFYLTWNNKCDMLLLQVAIIDAGGLEVMANLLGKNPRLFNDVLSIEFLPPQVPEP
jgi:hypothetical protein